MLNYDTPSDDAYLSVRRRMMMLPLCFVLMPFGKKTIPSGATVDFDAVN